MQINYWKAVAMDQNDCLNESWIKEGLGVDPDAEHFIRICDAGGRRQAAMARIKTNNKQSLVNALEYFNIPKDPLLRLEKYNIWMRDIILKKDYATIQLNNLKKEVLSICEDKDKTFVQNQFEIWRKGQNINLKFIIFLKKKEKYDKIADILKKIEELENNIQYFNKQIDEAILAFLKDGKFIDNRLQAMNDQKSKNGQESVIECVDIQSRSDCWKRVKKQTTNDKAWRALVLDALSTDKQARDEIMKMADDLSQKNNLNTNYLTSKTHNQDTVEMSNKKEGQQKNMTMISRSVCSRIKPTKNDKNLYESLSISERVEFLRKCDNQFIERRINLFNEQLKEKSGMLQCNINNAIQAWNTIQKSNKSIRRRYQAVIADVKFNTSPN